MKNFITGDIVWTHNPNNDKKIISAIIISDLFEIKNARYLNLKTLDGDFFKQDYYLIFSSKQEYINRIEQAFRLRSNSLIQKINDIQEELCNLNLKLKIFKDQE